MALKLSQKSEGDLGMVTRNSVNKEWIHNNSATEFATALYSASVQNLATARCLEDFQDIKLEP